MQLNIVILSVFFFKISACVLNETDQGELVAVVAIIRHGDRAPFSSFPTDKYFKKDYWPMGFGELTPKGMERQYKLGQWLRQRYNGFLSDYYLPDEIYASSTDIDRSLMSALANLAGFYPPKGFQFWNQGIPWQPVPVHISEFVSHIEEDGCPKYDKILTKMKQEVYPVYEKQYSNLLHFISNKTGWETVTIDMVEELMDVLFTYQHHDASYLPDWNKDLDYKSGVYLSGAVYEIRTHSLPLARYRIGTFYDYIFKFFNKFNDPTFKPSLKQRKSPLEQRSKFLFLMSHESTIISVLNTIGAYNMTHIEYADTLLLEFRKRKDGGHFVNVLLKHNDELSRLNIFKCDFDCDYEEVKRILSNITINYAVWKNECFT